MICGQESSGKFSSSTYTFDKFCAGGVSAASKFSVGVPKAGAFCQVFGNPHIGLVILEEQRAIIGRLTGCHLHTRHRRPARQHHRDRQYPHGRRSLFFIACRECVSTRRATHQ
jgi:hypothetical protein